MTLSLMIVQSPLSALCNAHDNNTFFDGIVLITNESAHLVLKSDYERKHQPTSRAAGSTRWGFLLWTFLFSTSTLTSAILVPTVGPARVCIQLVAFPYTSSRPACSSWSLMRWMSWDMSGSERFPDTIPTWRRDGGPWTSDPDSETLHFQNIVLDILAVNVLMCSWRLPSFMSSWCTMVLPPLTYKSDSFSKKDLYPEE